MFGAIDHEDALGVVESLPPSERKVLRDPLVDSTKELQRLGILKSFSLNDVPGADLKVTGLTTSTTTLGDGVVLVDVTGGTISGTSIPDDVPIGDGLRSRSSRTTAARSTSRPTRSARTWPTTTCTWWPCRRAAAGT